MKIINLLEEIIDEVNLGSYKEQLETIVSLLEDGYKLTDDFELSEIEYILKYDPFTCNTCSGSGEGSYDGSRCWRCKGSGVDNESKRMLEHQLEILNERISN